MAATAHGALAGAVGGDATLTVANAVFADKHVGSGKTVTAALSLDGADAANYTVNATAETTASITAVVLTGTITADNKPYDGTTGATAHGALAGLVGTDAVSLTVTNAAFADKQVGVGKAVTASLSLGGADAGNYSVNPTAATTANITAAALVGSITADSKPYDGTTAATVHATLAGLVGADAVSLSATNAAFADKHVGAAKAVTADLSLTGADAGNYHGEPDGGDNGEHHANRCHRRNHRYNKAYDGTTAATAHGAIVAGVVSGDVVTVTATNAAFADKHVGAAKTVTANLSLSGVDAGNYTVNPTASATASITTASLTGTIAADNKPYDGTVAASVHGSIAGVAVGDVVVLARRTQPSPTSTWEPARR